jgi:hypothetical protein
VIHTAAPCRIASADELAAATPFDRKDLDMPSFSAQVQNPLGKQQATERLKGFMEQIAERFKDQLSQVDGVWSDNRLDFSLTTYGFHIKGEVTVGDDFVRLRGDLPLVAVAFRKTIEESIAGELNRALS